MNIQSYAELGWSFFPVKGPHYGKDYEDSKAPALAWKPFQSRKPTSQEVTEWQQKLPKMSIGVPTGPLNNFMVVDLDGNNWMLHFPDADFGVTWKSKSTRGCHFYYQWEDWMLDIPTTRSKLDEIKGFDVRGQGGYVVVPNDNDSARTWEIHPADQPLIKMPDWLKTFLLQALSKNKKKQKAASLSTVSEGNRHSLFLSYTGKLQRAGLEATEIIDILSPIAEKTGFTNEMVDLVNDVAARYPVDRRKELRPETADVLLSEPEPPLDWLIEGLWVNKAKGFIAGHPGTGKTWIALDMLFAVATGSLCLSRYKAAYRAPVLIVEEEASRRNLQRRIHCMARARNLVPADIAQFYHLTQQLVSIPHDKEELLAFILEKKIKFVVFDSLREIHSAKENSSDDMRPVLQALNEISVIGGCAVLLIHHLSKTNQDNASKSIFEKMRGTGSFWAWRDCVLGIEGEEESTICRCSFQFRDAESPKQIQIERHVGDKTGAIGLQASDLIETIESQEEMTEIEEFVKTRFGGASGNEIWKGVGGKKDRILAVIKVMAKRGKLIKGGTKWVVPFSGEPQGTEGTS